MKDFSSWWMRCEHRLWSTNALHQRYLTSPNCTTQHQTALHSTTLHYTVLRYTPLRYTPLYYNPDQIRSDQIRHRAHGTVRYGTVTMHTWYVLRVVLDDGCEALHPHVPQVVRVAANKSIRMHLYRCVSGDTTVVKEKKEECCLWC